jgi:hypothetical protein
MVVKDCSNTYLPHCSIDKIKERVLAFPNNLEFVDNSIFLEKNGFTHR